MSDANDSVRVVLKRNGDMTIMEDGVVTVIAHYDAKSGRLEFTSKLYLTKYYNQVTARLGTVANGTEVSGNVIRSYGYAGDGYAEAVKANPDRPKRPKLGPEGDAAEEVVQYYLDNNLPEAIARYGIYTTPDGKIVRKHVRRIVKNLIDQRNADVQDIEEVKSGNNFATKAPVSFQGEIIEERNGIIARRATRLTFTPSEVVGGWQPDEEEETSFAALEGGEE